MLLLERLRFQPRWVSLAVREEHTADTPRDRSQKMISAEETVCRLHRQLLTLYSRPSGSTRRGTRDAKSAYRGRDPIGLLEL